MAAPAPAPAPLASGVRTTEFWVVLLMIGCQVTLAALDKVDKTWATVGISTVTLAYTVLRSLLKSMAAK